MNKSLNKRKSDFNENDLNSKKSKINEYFASTSGRTSSLESSDINSKELIKELINNNDSRVTFIEIKSSSVGCQKFNKVLIDGSKTDYAKRKSCSSLVKFVHKSGTSNLNNHICY
jgi:hypothetical protein